MGRIFVTGDTHNNIDIKKINTKNFPEQKKLNKEDVLIIAGDFGLPWSVGESSEDKWWLDWYNEKNFTTVFVDGNHENFDALNNYKTVEFNGAECHQLRNSVYHVKRGEVLTIGSYKILCMGGAVSVDKAYRREHISWWKEEEPNYQEWEKAFSNLDNANIIISHDGPSSIVRLLHHGEPTSVNKMFERLCDKITSGDINIQKWFIGHHHMDVNINHYNLEFQILYNKIIKL